MSRDQEQQLAKAEQLLRQGDIQGARLLLEYLLSTGSPNVVFKLAETYDPKRLATWQAFGVRADPQKARELYQKAQAGGIKDAQERISGLR
jgi:TPR repeat protein